MAQKNFKRQMYQVQGFEIPPYGYVLTEFSTEEWGHSIFVKREYRKPEWKSQMAYHEGVAIGVRGAVKKIYFDLS